jgi:hypothetical protein
MVGNASTELIGTSAVMTLTVIQSILIRMWSAVSFECSAVLGHGELLMKRRNTIMVIVMPDRYIDDLVPEPIGITGRCSILLCV